MATITIDPNYGFVPLFLPLWPLPPISTSLYLRQLSTNPFYNSWVILAATSTFVLSALHSINTGKYRGLAKVPYPAAYAPESRTDDAANKFNCAQRAHANFSENHPAALASLLIAGLQFPVSAAVLGAAWSVTRYLYMVGYSQGGTGKGRYRGISFWMFQVGLLGLTAWSGVSLVLGW
jgi:glutathione S-transferase